MNQHQELSHRGLLRWGAASGILGVVAALVQSAIDPYYDDDPGEAIQQASLSHFLTFSRLLDMTAFLLMLVGMTVVLRVFVSGPGAGWAKVAGTLYTVSAAAGSIATMAVGSLPDVARSWADAAPALKPGYVAFYDSLGHVSGGIFAVSWTALGIFGAAYTVALVRSDVFSSKLAYVSAVSGVALLSAMVLGIGFQMPVAFVLLILGLLLSYVVIVGSSIKVWRLTGATAREAEPAGERLLA